MKSATEAADPTTYSVIGPHQFKEDPTNQPWESRVLDADTGETFFMPNREPKAAEAEFVISKLLKGVLPVADIVRDSKNVQRSRKIDLDRIGTSASKEEILAEIVIMTFVFNDADHKLSHITSNPHNISLLRAGKGFKHAFYDFADAVEIFEKERDSSDLRYIPLSCYDSILQKTQILTSHLEGSTGTAFISHILSLVNKPLEEVFNVPERYKKEAKRDPAGLLQRTILRRLQNLQKSVQKFKAERAGEEIE